MADMRVHLSWQNFALAAQMLHSSTVRQPVLQASKSCWQPLPQLAPFVLQTSRHATSVAVTAGQSLLSQASSKVAQLEPGAPPALGVPAAFGAPPTTSLGAPPTISLGAPALLGVVTSAPPAAFELPARPPRGVLVPGMLLLPPLELAVPPVARALVPAAAGASSGFWVVMPQAAMSSAATRPAAVRVRFVAERWLSMASLSTRLKSRRCFVHDHGAAFQDGAVDGDADDGADLGHDADERRLPGLVLPNAVEFALNALRVHAPAPGGPLPAQRVDGDGDHVRRRGHAARADGVVFDLDDHAVGADG